MREIIDTSQQEQILVTISSVTSDQPTSLDEASSKISGCLCKEACPLRLPRQFAGIVTDVGSSLSHSSIVAREYRIPAVLGTGVATERLHTGQNVIVDGDAGTVTPSR